jgi:hypothetical protein
MLVGLAPRTGRTPSPSRPAAREDHPQRTSEGDEEAEGEQWERIGRHVAHPRVEEGRRDDPDESVGVARLDPVAVEEAAHLVEDLDAPHERRHADDEGQAPTARALRASDRDMGSSP